MSPDRVTFGLSIGDLTRERPRSRDQLAQWPVKNNQLHHNMRAISTPNAHATRTRRQGRLAEDPATQWPIMIHNGNQSNVARFTEKNQYDKENASTWTPTQLASPHMVLSEPADFRARRLTTMHQMTTPMPTAMEIISPRNTAAHHG
jgi:hypothetical protein